MQETEEQFDQVIPHAADRAEQFLGVLQQRCDEADIGINLQPAKRRRNDVDIVLRASVDVGKGLRKAAPIQLEVFADPMGSSLHVGWQANREVIGGFASNFRAFQETQRRIDVRNNNVNNVRALSGILQAFQVTVFLPVLQQLADAVQQQHATASRNGFLGA